MNDSSSAVGRLFRELRRRRVFRVGALYVVGAWLVMQAGDVFFPAWGIPDSAINYLLTAAALGFPLALIFGWLFDISAGGIRRTRPAGAEELAAALPLQRSDFVILAAFAAVVGAILYTTIGGVMQVPRAEEGEPRPASEKPPNSIAVLPFVTMSGNPDSASFGDGISDEILNRLAAYPDLHVIARTSSFALKDSGYDVPRLAGLLGVRYLLQGSVRSDGEQLRITAQLVDESGRQLWSNAFDRQLRGIFAIQAEIADSVASQVAPQIVPAAASESPPDLEAYRHYLIGREALYRRGPEFFVRAERHLQRALGIDPRYAQAHAELAVLWALTSAWHADLDTQAHWVRRAQHAIDEALALQPRLARAHAAQGLLHQQRHRPDYAGSEVALRTALALNPNMIDASNWLASAVRAQGRYAESFAILEQAARVDPLASPLIDNLALLYAQRGEFVRAEQSLLRLLELPQPSVYVYLTLAEFYGEIGRLVDCTEMTKRFVLAQVRNDGAVGYDLLGASYARLGAWQQAEYWLDRHSREGAQDWSGPAVIDRAELLRLQGRSAELSSALKEAATVHAAKLKPDVAARLGTLQALAGHYEEAVLTLEEAVDTNSADMETGPLQALAWAHQRTGGAARARTILSEIDEFFRAAHADGRLHLSSELALYAQNKLLAGDEQEALDLLQRAVAAGWREFYSLTNDPRWSVLAHSPRLRTLVTAVKADIDAQRALVERIDAQGDFVARLDQALAASRPGAGT